MMQESHDNGNVLMENDVWMVEEGAVTEVGADEVARLREALRVYLERAWAGLNAVDPPPDEESAHHGEMTVWDADATDQAIAEGLVPIDHGPSSAECFQPRTPIQLDRAISSSGSGVATRGLKVEAQDDVDMPISLHPLNDGDPQDIEGDDS